MPSVHYFRLPPSSYVFCFLFFPYCNTVLRSSSFILYRFILYFILSKNIIILYCVPALRVCPLVLLIFFVKFKFDTGQGVILADLTSNGYTKFEYILIFAEDRVERKRRRLKREMQLGKKREKEKRESLTIAF